MAGATEWAVEFSGVSKVFDDVPRGDVLGRDAAAPQHWAGTHAPAEAAAPGRAHARRGRTGQPRRTEAAGGRRDSRRGLPRPHRPGSSRPPLCCWSSGSRSVRWGRSRWLSSTRTPGRTRPRSRTTRRWPPTATYCRPRSTAPSPRAILTPEASAGTRDQRRTAAPQGPDGPLSAPSPSSRDVWRGGATACCWAG